MISNNAFSAFKSYISALVNTAFMVVHIAKKIGTWHFKCILICFVFTPSINDLFAKNLIYLQKSEYLDLKHSILSACE